MLNPWKQTTLQRQRKRRLLDDDIVSKNLESSTLLENKTSQNSDFTIEVEDLSYNAKEQRAGVKEAQKEIIKTQVKDREQNQEKLNRLVDLSSTVLLSIKTVFPFTFFPNEVIITLNDVSVVYTEFFISKQVRSVAISKIAEVIVTTGFFFAQLKIIDKEYSQLTMEIDYLTIKNAMKAKRLIQGLLFATKEGVELTKIEDQDLVEKIEELGRVQGESLDQSN